MQQEAPGRASPRVASTAVRDLDRWLGDGGMPLLGQLGAALTAYGEGWATAEWRPTPISCNPGGTVQAGVQSVVLDAVMNFALLAALEPGERCATLEMKVSTMLAARAGEDLTVRGEVLRTGRRVAFVQSFLRHGEQTLTHATGTFAVFRPDAAGR